MSKPEISRITPFEGGETVQIFCENADKNSTVYWWRPTEGENKDSQTMGTPNNAVLPELPPEGAKELKIYDAADNVIYITYDIAPGGTGCFWVKNDEGFSKPFVANAPEIWFQSVKEIYPGGTVTVYGDKFWSNMYKKVGLKNKQTGEFSVITPIQVKSTMYAHTAYRHQTIFKVPEDAADGEYEIFVHNGTGSEFGWSDSVDIKVKKEYTLTDYYRTSWNRETIGSVSMPKSEIIAVEPDIMGAHTDMTDKLQAAIDFVFENGGGTVMLGAGTYGVSRTLTLKPGVVLQGAGKGATTVRSVYGKDFSTDWSDVYYAERKSGGKHWAVDWKAHWDKLKNNVFVRIYNDAGVSDMRFELGNGVNMGVLVGSNERYGTVNGAFLNNVCVDGSGINVYLDDRFGQISAGIVSVSNTRELTLFRNEFSAICPIYILPADNRGAKMIENVFRCCPMQKDESYICGFHESIFEENRFLDGRRSFMAQEGFSDNWVYQNRSEGVGRGGNANEVYMSEYGDSDWSGLAYEIGSDYIKADLKNSGETNGEYDQSRGTMSADDIYEYPRFLVVLKGRGFGQYRTITAVDGDKVSLDKPWTVLPDENTAFTIVYGTHHVLWINNNSSLSNSHSQFIWNCGIENIIEGHEINMSAGIRLYSNCYYAKKNTTCVVAFNRIVHCSVRGGGKGVWLDSDGNRISDRPDYIRYTGGGCFGNSVRQCAFDGSAHMQYVKNLPVFKTNSGVIEIGKNVGIKAGGAFNTFCNNLIGGYKTAVELLDETKGNCFENNSYFGYDVLMSGKGTPVGCDVKNQHVKLF